MTTVAPPLRSARCGCRMAMVEMAKADFFECPHCDSVCTVPLCARCRRIKVRGR